MTTPGAEPAEEPGRGIEPDTKDWTWTLERPCPECGFDAGSVVSGEVAARIRAVIAPWPAVLERPGARDRPDPATWSPLEYACHVRDVCRIFDRRLRAMLDEDDPLFDNWDQDRTAVEDRYDEQDPATVAAELTAAGVRFAATYDGVDEEAWDRPGRRSNGSRFTILTLGQYGLHDLAHHLNDVGAAVP